jgi:transposase
MVKIVADGGYRGELIQNTRRVFGWVLEIVLKSDSTLKFQVLPKRWIVERTFSYGLSREHSLGLKTIGGLVKTMSIRPIRARLWCGYL